MDIKSKHLHFMGIGGIGVSALAEMALAEGGVVSGCDREESSLTRRLQAKGIEIKIGHDASHMAGMDLLVYTSAVPPEHPERAAAAGKQEKRGKFLARFMPAERSVGISGTHGKTTTTWMLSHLLIECGCDPSVYLGGVSRVLPDGNFRMGKGWFVAELDESDESFLEPRLATAVITNIESDHLSHYHDYSRLVDAFSRYAQGVEKSGLLMIGVDNPEAARLFERHPGRKLGFGLVEQADVRAVNLRFGDGMQMFDLIFKGKNLGIFSLPLPGCHNIKNALAALGVCLDLGVDPEKLRLALTSVKGVERRLEKLLRLKKTHLYTDYAHHPTEVEASISGLRQLHKGKILVVFQPHLYSRTRDYAEDFGYALAGADTVLLVDIYPAREDPIPGVTSQLVVDFAKKKNPNVLGPVKLGKVEEEVLRLFREFEAVVFMGAGSIDAVARKIEEKL